MNVPNSRKATAFVVCEDEELEQDLHFLEMSAQNMAALNELVKSQKDKSGIADHAVSIKFRMQPIPSTGRADRL